MREPRELHYRDGPVLLRGIVWGEEADGQRPGVVVFHDAMGLGTHATERARMLAEMGYVALAADLYGNQLRPRDAGHAMQLLLAFRGDVEGWRRRARASVDALASLPAVDRARLGAIGFCFGGSTAIELARSGAPMRATVCFHGGLETSAPAEVGRIAGRILVCTGSKDSRVPLAQLQPFISEMDAAEVDCEVVVYSGTQHSFTNQATNGIPGMAYNERADRRSWDAMRSFFEENLRGGHSQRA